MDRREAIKRTALLTGFAISASTISAVLQACQAETTSNLVEWIPKFFSKEEGIALAEIGELILPATDTPGAKDVLAHEFVDHMASVCMTPEDQDRFKKGMVQLLADYQTQAGKAFIEATAEEQLAFLNGQDQAARTLVKENPDLSPEEAPFFLSLKQMILLGYFTSEKVGTEVTAYLPIPGENIACMPYEEGTPAWTF